MQMTEWSGPWSGTRAVLKRQKWLLSLACRIAVAGFLGARTPPSVLQNISISH